MRDAALASAIIDAIPRLAASLDVVVPTRPRADHGLRLRMSDLGRCPRQVSYRLLDGEPPLDGRTALMFLAGHFYERVVVDALTSLDGVRLVPHPESGQWRVAWEQPPVTGYLDAVVHMPVPYPDGPTRAVVVEVKSAGTYTFQRLARSATLAEAFPAYHAQLQGYLHATGLDQGLCLMACRATPDLIAEWVPRDGAAVDALRERAARTWLAVADGRYADPDPHEDECRSCPYRDRCEVGRAASGTRRRIRIV